MFILLDGTWREAKKMFRKSPYLAEFPVLGIDEADSAPGYHIRKASLDGQLATAEVAAKVLELAGEREIARHLSLWFEVFSYRYQQGVRQTNKGREAALDNYLEFTGHKKSRPE